MFAPLEVFCCYAREDQEMLERLKKHLAPMQRSGQITIWSDFNLNAGVEWEKEQHQHLESADIVLLLISPDFMNSDYCYSTEMARSIQRHDEGSAHIIPILLRSTYWKDAPFANIQMAPMDAKPVTRWPDLDDALHDITVHINRVVSDLRTRSAQREVNGQTYTGRDALIEPIVISPITYRLSEVFVKSGFPNVTFVERDDFVLLKLALEQPGRGVIIEGPSGIGKTTSVEKVVRDLEAHYSHLSMQQVLSARNPIHRDRLRTIREWNKGTVVIDDFHRLDADLRHKLVDYLKELADTSSQTQKVVIVGIPRTGQALVDMSFDLATRLDVFSLSKVDDKLIFQVIEKGEEALNVRFESKADLVLAANGSLNLAQYLCFYVCALVGVTETQKYTRIIRSDMRQVTKEVLKDLKMKFGKSIKQFIAMGGSREVTCLRLLEELAMAEDSFLSLPLFKESRPDLTYGIECFLQEDWMSKLYSACPESENHLFFDSVRRALIIDDPQLGFYLKQVSFSTLAKETGKITTMAERRVFISYSHEDNDWLERLRVHLKPIEREGMIDLWVDTKIAAGLQWKDAILQALETACVAVLLVSGEFLASDFIAEHELPKLLDRAQAGGTIIIPVILSPSVFTRTKLGAFQAINDPKHPLTTLSHAKQETILVKVAEAIAEHFRAR
jgi:adenylate kinase family enzyme